MSQRTKPSRLAGRKRKHNEGLDERTIQLLGTAITEEVCKQFMDFLAKRGPAPFGLKADVYHRVSEVLRAGVEV